MRIIIAQTPLISPETPVRPDASEARSKEANENQQLPEPKTLYVRPPLLLVKAHLLTRLDAQIVSLILHPLSTPLTGRGSERSVLAVVRIHAVPIGTSRSTRATRLRALMRPRQPYFRPFFRSSV
jgi:hypothetical protein